MSTRDQLINSSKITLKPTKPDRKHEGLLGETSSPDGTGPLREFREVGEPTAEQIKGLESLFQSFDENASHVSPEERATSLDDPSTPTEMWTVRGVSEETRRLSKIAALMMRLPIGEFVNKALFDAVREDAETLRGRAAAMPKGKKGKIWTIRGVTPETRKLSRIAALQLGWTVGEFVERALLDATERLQIKSSFP